MPPKTDFPYNGNNRKRIETASYDGAILTNICILHICEIAYKNQWDWYEKEKENTRKLCDNDDEATSICMR